MAKTVTVSGLSTGVTISSVSIPTAATWLTKTGSGTVYSFTASTNTGDQRSTTVTFTASDGAITSLTVTQQSAGNYSNDYNNDYF